MKVFFDTEFIEDGKTIDLISIGMVKSNGETLYMVSSECDYSKASDWVKENVLPHVEGERWKYTREEIANAVIKFCGDAPEFWAYYADYDWVVFCQLFGAMIDLPEGFPMYCRDIKQLCDSVGNPRLPEQESDEHNALADAEWNKEAFEFLAQYKEENFQWLQ